MKNRLSKMGRKASWMFILLAVCGVSSSCKDDYTLDDEKPSWLNSSIYESLESQGIYKNYLRLLGDPDVNPTNARPLTEVLSRTGSKTVFVADDDAWNAFYANNATLPESNPWHNATCYENLSVSQKKLLIHTSMLPNAIVMENLASNEGGSGKNVERGQYMRRYTDVEATDTITYVDGSSLPFSYCEDKGEKDFWARFRDKKDGTKGKGIYMVCDSTQSMMLHFTNEHMKNNNVTDEDFRHFMRRDRLTSDVHIYDALLTDKDEVCENGYINKTEKVIMPLPNMAEVIRTNGKTNIFSHMLDRWSVPFYNRGVTEAYKKVMDSRGITWTDSIFTKRYFSDISFGKRSLGTDPDNIEFKDDYSPNLRLKFDPGWNGYYNEKPEPQYDMASMFVPNDEALWRYFSKDGKGYQLIKTYYTKEGTPEEKEYEAPQTLDDLYKQIDQIPRSTLRSLINVIMFNSFVSSVPSKMTQLRDDAQEQIFKPEDVNHIIDAKLACNGVVYITDNVWGPADYTSVAAPAYISKTNLIMRFAIYNGSDDATDYMKLNYYAYLKAMQSFFALFLPSDKGMGYYYDAVSFLSKRSRVVKFSYNSDAQGFPIDNLPSRYNAETGVIGEPYLSAAEKLTESDVVNRLKDILESHTVVLDETNSIPVMNGTEEILVMNPENEFFISKNGSPVRIIRDESGEIKKVQGGFQMSNERAGIIGEGNGLSVNNVTEKQSMANGTTYILDSPIVPAGKSVYSIVSDNDEYSLFYQLCSTNDSIIRACGLVDENKLTDEQEKSEMKKYKMFIDRENMNSKFKTAPDFNVEFFNSYRYTIFVPTNSAIEEAVSNGLPTWESIDEDWKSCIDSNGRIKTAEDSLRIQTKVLYLLNFLRYHFADNSVFVDHSNFNDNDMVTASYDSQKGLFMKVNTRRNNDVLQVRSKYETKDGNKNVTEYGDWRTVDGLYNVMARDIICNESPSGKESMGDISIEGSSFAVIHQIDGVLYQSNEEVPWKVGMNACKKYIKKYAIR